MAQVRRLADEVLVLDARRRHAGLDDVVLGLELVAVRAVALLQAACRAVYANAARHQSMRPPRLPQRVPQLESLLDRHVQLPAQVTHVRDARGEPSLRADLEAGARA